MDLSAISMVIRCVIISLAKVSMQWALANMDRKVDCVLALNQNEIEFVFTHHVAIEMFVEVATRRLDFVMLVDWVALK